MASYIVIYYAAISLLLIAPTPVRGYFSTDEQNDCVLPGGHFRGKARARARALLNAKPHTRIRFIMGNMINESRRAK